MVRLDTLAPTDTAGVPVSVVNAPSIEEMPPARMIVSPSAPPVTLIKAIFGAGSYPFAPSLLDALKVPGPPPG